MCCGKRANLGLYTVGAVPGGRRGGGVNMPLSQLNKAVPLEFKRINTNGHNGTSVTYLSTRISDFQSLPQQTNKQTKCTNRVLHSRNVLP